jgi:hypothetical protein
VDAAYHRELIEANRGRLAGFRESTTSVLRDSATILGE